MLPRADSYDELRTKFRWRVPARYNIGADVCDKWAEGPDRTALIHRQADGAVRRYGFLELKRLSNRLANVLKAQGLDRDDRVAILLPQAPETAIAHIAAYKLGTIAVPLFTLFGPEALDYRLSHSGAKALITDRAGLEKVADLRDRLP